MPSPASQSTSAAIALPEGSGVFTVTVAEALLLPQLTKGAAGWCIRFSVGHIQHITQPRPPLPDPRGTGMWIVQWDEPLGNFVVNALPAQIIIELLEVYPHRDGIHATYLIIWSRTTTVSTPDEVLEKSELVIPLEPHKKKKPGLFSSRSKKQQVPPEIHFFIIPPSYDEELTKTQTLISAARTQIAELAQSRPARVIDKVTSSQASALKSTVSGVDWSGILGLVEKFVNIADTIAEVHPYAQIAWCVFSAAFKPFLSQRKYDQRVADLGTAMQDALTFVNDHGQLDVESLARAPKYKERLQSLLAVLTDCAGWVTEYEKRSFTRRAMGFRDPEKDVKAYLDKFAKIQQSYISDVQFDTQLENLKMNIKSQESLRALQGGVTSILGRLDAREESALIHELPYMLGATYQVSMGCLPGTRLRFLDGICAWISASAMESSSSSDSTSVSPASSIYLLHGTTGSGKSAIAHEVAKTLDNKLKWLASFFGFKRDMQRQNAGSSQSSSLDPLVLNLARDLASYFPAFKTTLAAAVQETERERQHNPPLSVLFQKLIVEPFKTVEVRGPLVWVIDAIDECDAPEALAEFLAAALPQLPSGFKVFMTTRNERSIVSTFEALLPGLKVDAMVDRTLGADIMVDLDYYMCFELQKRTKEGVSIFGEVEDHIPKLVAKSEGNFQWAVFACKYIRDSELAPLEALRGLLRSSGEHPLDTAYLMALQGSIKIKDSGVRARYQEVMSQFLAVLEPLSVRSLLALHASVRNPNGLSEGKILRILPRIGGLLLGVDDLSQPVRVSHTSFRDFLLDRKRSQEFWVDLEAGHRHLAELCLHKMLSTLKFNLLKHPSSCLTNKEMADMVTPPPLELVYACMYWGTHIKFSPLNRTLLDLCDKLLKTWLLPWLEIMSWKGRVDTAVISLDALQQWLGHSQVEKSKQQQELCDFAQDASTFVRAFGTPISQSAPHIYVSALPFAPSHSLVAQRYRGAVPNCLQVVDGKLVEWPAQQMLVHTEGPVISLAVSPDGKIVASGSRAGAVSIWQAQTGQLLAGPLEDQSSYSITSLGISATGKVASGSANGVLCFWDAAKGVKIHRFPAHEAAITSVAFSKNGDRLVTGSQDATIRVRNTKNFQLVCRPMTGHSTAVTDVAFSPQEDLLVSTSEDGTLCTWKTRDYTLLTEPVQGLECGLNAVTFLPHPKKLIVALGGDDGTFVVYDLKQGTVLGQINGAPYGRIVSMSCSSDGSYVASGSQDGSVRVWDTETFSPVGDPLRGHQQGVHAVRFLGDSRHIISGSEDGTIITWDIQAQQNASPTRGHQTQITALAYSPSGKYLISGGDERNLFMWNAYNGERFAIAHDGPEAGVTSLVWCPTSDTSSSVIVGSQDSNIYFYDIDRSGIHRLGDVLHAHENPIECLVLSWDNEFLMSASADGMIAMWDLSTKSAPIGVLWANDTTGVRAMALTVDGQFLVIGACDGCLHIFDLPAQKRCKPKLESRDCNRPVTAVACHPKDEDLIVSGHDDGSICFWNKTKSSQPLFVRISTTAIVDSLTPVAYSPDGKHVVSGHADGSCKIWDAMKGEFIRQIQLSSGPVTSIIFSPPQPGDDPFFSCGTEAGTIYHIWLSPQAPLARSPPPPISFNDESRVCDDGWVRGELKGKAGPRDGLLFWVPDNLRLGILGPSLRSISGVHQTRLDWSSANFHSEWAKPSPKSSKSSAQPKRPPRPPQGLERELSL